SAGRRFSSIETFIVVVLLILGNLFRPALALFLSRGSCRLTGCWMDGEGIGVHLCFRFLGYGIGLFNMVVLCWRYTCTVKGSEIKFRFHWAPSLAGKLQHILTIAPILKFTNLVFGCSHRL